MPSRRSIALGLTAAILSTAAALPASAATKSYTLAQVKAHSKASNCWTAINGNVYNVTKWVTRHPGGSSVIVMLCGKDGSAAFVGRHGNQGQPNATLASFKVGKLKK